MVAGCALLLACGALLAQPPALTIPPNRAMLIVRVPPDAVVTVGGEATRQTGLERIFTTPALEPGFTYSYEVVATWKKDGKDATASRTVQFQPGELKTVDLRTVGAVPSAGQEKKVEPEKKLDKQPEKKLEKQPEKTKTAKAGKDKTPTVELKTVAGVIKTVDEPNASFTIALDGGQSRTFLVTEDTKFVGPKGGSRGMGRPALKDATMVQGSAVLVAPAADGKTALEVRLPARKK
jgi:uncharacterized protein (TIGR03000 family)